MIENNSNINNVDSIIIDSSVIDNRNNYSIKLNKIFEEVNL